MKRRIKKKEWEPKTGEVVYLPKLKDDGTADYISYYNTGEHNVPKSLMFQTPVRAMSKAEEWRKELQQLHIDVLPYAYVSWDEFCKIVERSWWEDIRGGERTQEVCP